MMDLSIIIVNYNAKDVLSQCLNSIYDNTKDVDFQITVIDNASGDGSPQIIRQRFPRVKLIQNNVNSGLTQAQNQGLKLAQGKYLLLLNNDTYLQPQAINKLIEFMDQNPDGGIAGPRIYTNANIQISFAWMPKNPHLFLPYILFKKLFLNYELRRHNYNLNNNLEVDYVSGACLMIRKTIMENIGYMDEGYFVYNEDDDLCLRVRQKGYKIYYLPEAKVIHLRGKGGGGLHPYRMILEIHKGIFRLYRKFYPKPNFLLDTLILGMLTLRLGLAIIIQSVRSLKRLFFRS
ncbi:MAG: glycosyltransferase family 2 protein [Candidatus Omnitrophota bacterium]